MQLLQTGSSYCVYRAWGRVGGGGAGGKSGGGKSKSVPGYLNSDVVHEHGVDLDGEMTPRYRRDAAETGPG